MPSADLLFAHHFAARLKDGPHQWYRTSFLASIGAQSHVDATFSSDQLFSASEEHYISRRKVQESLFLELRQLPETCRKAQQHSSLSQVYKITQLVHLITTRKPSEHDQILTLLQCVRNDDVRLDAIKDHHTVVNLSLRWQLFRTDAASNCFLFLGRRSVSRRTDRPNDFLAIRRSRG